ncbi:MULTISPECIES: helicase [Pectobacterium]|uniref:helicase n=1 Tax=Pectobacterium TaxID=122277 RepID=UPI001886C4D3|nr:helicase [Pectobacterium carotovorum]
MKNDKSLQEKQLIRAIADLIIQNPSRARELFGNLDKIVMLYPELDDICKLVTEFISNDYIEKLSIKVNEINDKVTKNIFISALDSYLKNQKKKSSELNF